MAKTPEDWQRKFEEDNPYAKRAVEMAAHVIDGPQDPRNPGTSAYLLGAQTYATLALAYEQFMRAGS